MSSERTESLGEASAATTHTEAWGGSVMDPSGRVEGGSPSPATLATSKRPPPAEACFNGDDATNIAAPESKKRRRRRGKKHLRRNGCEDAESDDASSALDAQTTYLIQFTCNRLKAQALEYELRAREMEEKNKAQALEIEAWEKKVRALRRRLHDMEYDERETTSALLAPEAADSSRRDPAGDTNKKGAVTTTGPAPIGAAESLVPARVEQIDSKVQQFLRESMAKLDAFSQSLPDTFKDTLEQRIERLTSWTEAAPAVGGGQ